MRLWKLGAYAIVAVLLMGIASCSEDPEQAANRKITEFQKSHENKRPTPIEDLINQWNNIPRENKVRQALNDMMKLSDLALYNDALITLAENIISQFPNSSAAVALSGGQSYGSLNPKIAKSNASISAKRLGFSGPLADFEEFRLRPEVVFVHLAFTARGDLSDNVRCLASLTPAELLVAGLSHPGAYSRAWATDRRYSEYLESKDQTPFSSTKPASDSIRAQSLEIEKRFLEMITSHQAGLAPVLEKIIGQFRAAGCRA